MKLKFILDKLFQLLMFVSALLVFGFFASIIWSIAKTGIPALSWDMVSKIPGGGFYLGKDGGILNAIVGSAMIVGASSVLGLVLSLPIVFYMNVYVKSTSRFSSLVRLTYDVLFGIPSIVYGAFAFTIMVYLGWKASLLGGILVTTLLIIPIFVRSMDEVVRAIPKDFLNATYSLGATKYETCKVVIRQIAPGIATATLLSVGRAIGDAAGVLFTAGFTDNIPTSLDQPAATLPLAVFFQLNSPVPEVRERAYASALLLTGIVFVISLAGRLLSALFSKNRIK